MVIAWSKSSPYKTKKLSKYSENYGTLKADAHTHNIFSLVLDICNGIILFCCIYLCWKAHDGTKFIPKYKSPKKKKK